MLYLSVTLLLAAASWLPALRAAEEQHELAVFLFAGQSNMAGADSFVGDPPGFRQTEADQAALFTTAPLTTPGGTSVGIGRRPVGPSCMGRRWVLPGSSMELAGEA
jgi:hypothetical protein